MVELSQFVKAAFQGGTGSGKSTTAALLLLGLSIEYHQKAPVFTFDTEPGFQFLEPVFALEGVKLEIRNGRHFKGMHDCLKEAQKAGACGFVVDSISHPWSELLERFADSTGRVAFHKFSQIKQLWNKWTVDFLNAPLHAIANGRLAWDYNYEVAEDGRKELVKGDSKMRAGGGDSFGYEPHLTCELSHERKKLKSGKLGGMEYHCLVLKDRSRVLNGRELIFDDVGEYKLGDYKHVLRAFKPHVERLRQIARVQLPDSTSAALVPDGNSDYYRRQQVKKAVLEDWDATMELIWPGTAVAMKHNRAIAGEAITGLRSRTKLEQLDPETLQGFVNTLLALEKRIKIEPAKNDEDLIAQVAMAGEEALSADAETVTLLEAQLQQSLEQAKAEPEKEELPF